MIGGGSHKKETEKGGRELLPPSVAASRPQTVFFPAPAFVVSTTSYGPSGCSLRDSVVASRNDCAVTVIGAAVAIGFGCAVCIAFFGVLLGLSTVFWASKVTFGNNPVAIWMLELTVLELRVLELMALELAVLEAGARRNVVRDAESTTVFCATVAICHCGAGVTGTVPTAPPTMASEGKIISNAKKATAKTTAHPRGKGTSFFTVSLYQKIPFLSSGLGISARVVITTPSSLYYLA